VSRLLAGTGHSARIRVGNIDPRAWLAVVLAHIADHPERLIAAVLPWNWKTARGSTTGTNLLIIPHRARRNGLARAIPSNQIRYDNIHI
jgi:hypothetical protein